MSLFAAWTVSTSNRSLFRVEFALKEVVSCRAWRGELVDQTMGTLFRRQHLNWEVQVNLCQEDLRLSK